jgi:hypothetical protein
MHEGLCLTLADVIKPAYWALVHSGGSPRALRGASANSQTFTKLTFGRPATRKPWPSAPALVAPMT